MTDAAAAPSFGVLMRAAAKLAAARQVSALLLAGAILALPLWVSRGWATDFTWAYFAMLTLTSLFGLGFERLAATIIADAGDGASPEISSLVVCRLATTPLAAIGLWILMAFVGVSLTAVAWCATLVWVMAALMALVGFGALRALKNSTLEPTLLLVARAGQALALVAVAVTGGGLELALASIAAIEVGSAWFALRGVGASIGAGGAGGRILGLPWRRVVGLAGIEVVALAYLRADLLLVGRLLGAGVGATYGMIYRVIDAVSTAIGSVGVWLYATNVTAVDDPLGADRLREQSLVLMPRLALLVGAVALFAAEIVIDVASLGDEETRGLQLLIAAFPLLAVNAIELHARSGQGRNREVLTIGTIALFVNVPLCLALIPTLGLPGAALALLASEVTQSAALWFATACAERATVGRGVAVGATGSLLLVVLGAVVRGNEAIALAPVVLLIVLLVSSPLLARARRSAVVP